MGGWSMRNLLPICLLLLGLPLIGLAWAGRLCYFYLQLGWEWAEATVVRTVQDWAKD